MRNRATHWGRWLAIGALVATIIAMAAVVLLSVSYQRAIGNSGLGEWSTRGMVITGVLFGLPLALEIGACIGRELAGIVDNGLDLDGGRLVVDWQLVPEEQRDRPGVTVPVHKPVMKSSASSRTVDLDSHTVAAVRRWRVARSEWQLEFGPHWLGGGPHNACRLGHGSGSGHGPFLFCWPDGRHLNPDWISHEFARICEEADVPVIRLHDVRHTHASLMLAGGEHLKVVQERLGWASSAFMLQSYTHLMPGMQRDAAERFAAGIFVSDDEGGEEASG